jgi:beta-lactamase class A
MTPDSITALERRIRELVADFPGLCTVALTDLGTEAHLGIDEQSEMPSESVIKVLVLATIFRAQMERRLSFDDRVSVAQHHQIFGTGVLQYLSPGVEMSVRDAAILMIIISDNPAFELCLDALGGIDYVNETALMLGMEGTRLKRRLTDRSTDPDGRGFAVTTARLTFAGGLRRYAGDPQAPAEPRQALTRPSLDRNRRDPSRTT